MGSQWEIINITVGVILFIFQIVNFISIETITPELERAQVISCNSFVNYYFNRFFI